jgi:hypothetical protein
MITMLMFWSLFMKCLVHMPQTSATTTLNQFFSDYVEFYKLPTYYVIMRGDEDVTMENITFVHSSVALIQYNTEDITLLAKHLNTRHPNIFFVGDHHEELLKSLHTYVFQWPFHIIMPRIRNTSVDHHFRLDTNIVFYEKTSEGFDLKEDFAIKAGPRIEQYIGNWTIVDRLQIIHPSIWQRRSDLRGILLHNCVMPYFKYTQVTLNEKEEVIRTTGTLQQVLFRLQEILNFTMVTSVPQDKQWGALLGNNKTWSGLVGMLVNNQSDLASSGLTVSAQRRQAIDMSFGLFDLMNTLISPVQPETEHLHISMYTNIFHAYTWISCFFILFLLSLVTMVTASFRNERNTRMTENVALGDTIGLAALMFVQRGYTPETKTYSAKLALVAGSFTGYIIFATFSSLLTASTTTGPTKVLIVSFEDVLINKYNVIVLKGGFEQSILIDSTPGSAMNRVYTEMMQTNAFVTSLTEAKEHILLQPKTLYFGEDALAAVNNDLTALKITESVVSSIAYAFQKDSEFTHLFNHHLMHLRTSGIINKEKRDWRDSLMKCPDNPTVAAASFNETGILFILVAGGILMSALALLFELLFKTCIQ